MLIQRSTISTLIEPRLSQGPQKAKFALKVQLLELHQNENSIETEECIETYANSLMTPVYAEGLTDELYWSMVEKKWLCCLRLSHLAVEVLLKKTTKLGIEFARYRTIRLCLRYLTSSPSVVGCSIRNLDDANCFKYCLLHGSISWVPRSQSW